MVMIQKAGPGDVTLIRDMALKIWPVTYQKILLPEQIEYMLRLFYSEDILQKQIEDDITFILAYEGKQPVGFASYQLIGSGLYKLHKIYVIPSVQGKGTGRSIIDQLIIEMKAHGATSLQLNVNRNNNAKLFYEKLGFEVIREEDIDIGNGFFMNDFLMEKKL